MVRNSGSRSWVLRTQVDGKRQDFGLGSAAKLPLAQARAQAAELRSRVKSGEEARPQDTLAKPAVPTFAAASRACHAAIKAGWINKHHRDSWLTSLETHVFPTIGHTPVDQVSSVMVRDALAPIWLVIPETARRMVHSSGPDENEEGACCSAFGASVVASQTAMAIASE